MGSALQGDQSFPRMHVSDKPTSWARAVRYSYRCMDSNIEKSRIRYLNAFTVDVEDYFHVAALSSSISRESWRDRKSVV